MEISMPTKLWRVKIKAENSGWSEYFVECVRPFSAVVLAAHKYEEEHSGDFGQEEIRVEAAVVK